MKKISLIVNIIFFICSVSTIINAQTIKLGVGGGLTHIIGPEGFTKETTEYGLGYSTEYNLGATIKIDLPLIPLTPRLIILYHSFNGSGNYSPILTKSLAPDPTVENSQSILSIGAGAQFGLIPIPTGIDPYFSLDLFLNKFGDFKQNFSDAQATPFPDINNPGGSRFGLQVGIGAEISIIPMINLDVSGGYNWFNIIGKEDGEETLSAATLDLFFIFNLN